MSPSSQSELHSLNVDYSSAPGGQPQSDFDDDDDLPLQLDQAGVSENFKYKLDVLQNSCKFCAFTGIYDDMFG